jgi:hypothetical protein
MTLEFLIIWVPLVSILGVVWFLVLSITLDDRRIIQKEPAHGTTDLEASDPPQHRPSPPGPMAQ